MESKKLSSPLKEEVNEAMKYVEDFQSRSEEVKEIQKPLDEIYQKTTAPILDIICSKTKPFVSQIQDLEMMKKETKHLSPREFPMKEIFLTAEIQKFYDWGVPIAAEPRVLFNSFISKKYVDRGINALFIQESLKKYYVRKKWQDLDHR